MTYRLRLTPRAQSDIDAIGRYTRKVWGAAQAAKYLSEIDRRMRWLCEDPNRGRLREDIAPGYRCHRQGSHLIFYLVCDREIAVIAVCHQSMDLPAHFEGDAP